MSYFKNSISTTTIREEATDLSNFELAYQGQGIIEKDAGVSITYDINTNKYT